MTAEPLWVPRLRAGLAAQSRTPRPDPVRPARGGRAAGVLVLIADRPAGPEVLFIERAATLRNHAHQIAFPGGAAEPGDVDLVDTALREAAEEIGVDRSAVEILGQLAPAHVAVSGFDVTAVVGWWRSSGSVQVVDPAEVASVPIVPVSDLLDPARRARVQHPSGYTGPAFEVADHLIWGLSAHLLDEILSLAGWQQPWDESRVLAIPTRYLTGRPDPGGPDAH